MREERFGVELSRASVPTPGSHVPSLNVCGHRWGKKDVVENGLPGQFHFLDLLARSTGPVSRDSALHNYGIHHGGGVRSPPFTTFTSVRLCINTIRFESSITKANKAGLGRDSKIT